MHRGSLSHVYYSLFRFSYPNLNKAWNNSNSQRSYFFKSGDDMTHNTLSMVVVVHPKHVNAYLKNIDIVIEKGRERYLVVTTNALFFFNLSISYFLTILLEKFVVNLFKNCNVMAKL